MKNIVKEVVKTGFWIKASWQFPTMIKNITKLVSLLDGLKTQVDNNTIDKKGFTKIKNTINDKIGQGFIELIVTQIDEKDKYFNPLLRPLWFLQHVFYLHLPKKQSNSYYGFSQEVTNLLNNTPSEAEFIKELKFPHLINDITNYEDSKKLRIKILTEIKKELGVLEPIANLMSHVEELIHVKPQKNVYQVIPATRVDIDRVSTLVKAMAKTIEDKLYKQHSDRIEFGIQEYEKSNKQQRPEEWARKNRNPYGIIFGSYYTNSNGKYELKKDYKTNIEKNAKELTDNTLNRFIFKNISKISPIISKKGALKDSNYSDIRYNRGEIEGELYFEFTDGSSFEVQNAIVQVLNAKTIFFRFPTTFHDVQMADGKKYKMVSEEWMNTVFVK